VIAKPLTASPRVAARLRSVEAYVLPHLIDVTAGAHGTVTSVDVVPRAIVRRGQRLATLQPAEPRRDDDDCAVIVRAPVTGLVTRCRVSVGETLRRASPLVSIASSENVLVSAKFVAGCLAGLDRDSAAVVLHGKGRDPIGASVISVIACEWALVDGPADAADARSTRVVLSLSNAPPEVLWPGTPVEVVIGE
jgi:hypothetical protein